MTYMVVITIVFIVGSFVTANKYQRDIHISYKPGILKQNPTSFNKFILFLFKYKNNQPRILYWIKIFGYIWFCSATIFLTFSYINNWHLNKTFVSIYSLTTICIYILLMLFPRLMLDIQKCIVKKYMK